ncbi:hypothetical protein Pyn_17645 [Prunus yedoensis var. nudiflora]|uniref:Uncharacterized protein n=1 Tax=Prunus yedoensis var. nudiflora TaxID=2094558 RepID=A0A314Y0J9_PRUYE|nr:hypothetical protein Pyn_17645 [Prunus yedoensis var. nudiflora]
MDYVQYNFEELESDASKVIVMVEGVKDLLMKMYEAYKKEEPAAAQSTAEANVQSGGKIGSVTYGPKEKEKKASFNST